MEASGGRTMYLLHGWTTAEESEGKWQPFISSLKQRGYEPKLLRLPGLLAPLDQVWGLDSYVAWLAGQIKEEKAILLGHSFGGQIAIRFSAQSHQKVDKLILIDNSGIRDRAWGKRIKRGLFYLLAKLGRPLVLIPGLRRLVYRAARATDYLNAPPLLRQTMSRVLRDEVLNDLPHIKTPTLIIWGKQDRVTPLKHGYLEQSKIKGAQLVVIEDGRHSPQFTHPEQVANLISEFIK